MPGNKCNGGPIDDLKECCNPRVRCGVGQGDCDLDIDCKNGLICGEEGQGKGPNCGPEFWETAECCRKPRK